MEEALKLIAGLMAVSARTAPKAVGQDYVTLRVITGEDVTGLADGMLEYGKEMGKTNFDRDGNNVRNSPAILLVGLKDAKAVGLNCGACGRSRCADIQKVEGPEFAGGICAWRLVDLGIAMGSAVKTASMLNADNRIMYRIGVVARRMGLIDADVVAGIPLSATGKSIYFDRK